MSENNNAPARGLSSTLVYAKRLKTSQSRGGTVGAAFQASWNPGFAAIISFALTIGDDLKKVDLGQLIIVPEDVSHVVDQAAVSAEFGAEVAHMVHAYMLEDGKVRDDLNRDDLAYLATLDYNGLLPKIYSQIQSEIPRADTAGSEFRSGATVGDTALLNKEFGHGQAHTFAEERAGHVPGASAVNRPSAVQAQADANRDLGSEGRKFGEYGHGTAELPGSTGQVAAGAEGANVDTKTAAPSSDLRQHQADVDYGLGSVNVESGQGKTGSAEAPSHPPKDPESDAAVNPPETAELPGNHPEDKADGANTPDPVTGDVPSK